MINVVIVDDEPQSRDLVELLIRKHFPQLEIKGSVKNEKEAYKLIVSQQPDLVFLDIELGESTAFNLLQRFKKISFGIIFITAYNEYAVNAFKVNAIDYLVKPIAVKEFKAAVEKALDRLSKKNNTTKIFADLLSQLKKDENKIAFNTAKETVYVDIDEIIRCEADGNTTICYLNSGQTIHSTKTLMDFESKLSKYKFLRVHSKHLVNQSYIVKLKKEGRNGFLLLKDGSTIPVSVRKKSDFLDNIESI